jgi:HD-like signal output (HDOD) protein
MAIINSFGTGQMRSLIQGSGANQMQSHPQSNLVGDELSKHRFELLQDIAAELSSDTTFPTSFDLLVRLRKALHDPNQTIDQITSLISIEPLIPLRLIRLANSVMYNRGQEVKDTKTAIQLLGLNVVRSAAMAIAMSQLLRSKDMVIFGDLPEKLWDHCLRSACAAYVISKRIHIARLNPDEAMLAGLVHDIGAFYLLYKFSQDEELRIRPDSTMHLVARWHESLGYTLLIALGVPQEIADSMVDHDVLRTLPSIPLNLADVVYVSNMLAGGMSDWLDFDENQEGRQQMYDHAREAYKEYLEDIDTYTDQMRSLLA